MRSFIIGTAGHIDHGKSSLVLALTGTDPDRLKEEKERGITIDLGFAHAPLSDAIEGSFIDVPGHERFVRQMLAGSHGIDAVMLIVAANEGVMPQTREHFDICRLLGVRRGLIALTKIDAVDAPAIDSAEASVRKLVHGSFLTDAPIVRVSAKTGAGVEDVRVALRNIAESTEPRKEDGVLRLPIDRVFSLKGFGTVITGTLASGAIQSGEEVVVLPSGRRTRVRTLQVHGARTERAVAGERTAANLPDLPVDGVQRGEVIARSGTLVPTKTAHVSLTLLPGARLRHGARVRVHAASAEILGRVRLAAEEAGAHGPAFAEIRFESEAVLARGDRLVIRRYSPAETIAGALTLDPAPRPRRRSELASLEETVCEGDAGAVHRFLKEAAGAGLTATALGARFGWPQGRAEKLVRDVPTVLVLPGGVFVDRAAAETLESRAIEVIRESHARDPLSPGISREELRSRVLPRGAQGLFDWLVADLAARGQVRVESEAVALSTHQVLLSSPAEAARAAVERALDAAGLSGLPLRDLHATLRQDRQACENAVRVLVQQKRAERLGEGLLLGAPALAAFRDEAKKRFKPGAKLDVADVKDLTGLSRKYVIPLLEWLDRERVTRRVGAERIVL